MYKILGTSNIKTRLCKTFKISKRAMAKEKLEDQACSSKFLRNCEDMPYRPKTGVLIVHPGEPTYKNEISHFMNRVGDDKTFTLAMPSIKKGGGWRTVKELQDQYTKIGGFSPLLKWAANLGYTLEKKLDRDLRPFSPFKTIVGYRYASPLITKALKEFEKDKIKHLVIFSLEPHYYCQKSGPCYDGIYKYYTKHKVPKWSWTVIDRWPASFLLAGVYAQTIQYELDRLPPEQKHDALIIFVGNGLHKEEIKKGELYQYEIGVTIHNIMQLLNYSNRYCLSWLSPTTCTQSIRPTLDEALPKAHRSGYRQFVVVPISYACDCLDTLYEIDIAIIQKYRDLWGCESEIHRTPAPNLHALVINAISHLIVKALNNERRGSTKFVSMCHGCSMHTCHNTKQFFRKLLKL